MITGIVSELNLHEHRLNNFSLFAWISGLLNVAVLGALGYFWLEISNHTSWLNTLSAQLLNMGMQAHGQTF